jgi:2-iminobutanoate/2-iminopropanoate deaminase
METIPPKVWTSCKTGNTIRAVLARAVQRLQVRSRRWPVQLAQFDPPRPYARASRVGDLIFLAGASGHGGHAAKDVHEEGLAELGIAEQTTIAFEEVRKNLDAEGLDFGDLVRLDVFLLNDDDAGPFMEVLHRYLPNGSPPGAMVCVKGFAHRGVLVEIEGIAAKRG